MDVQEEREVWIDERWFQEWFAFGLVQLEAYLRKHAKFNEQFPEEEE